MTDLTPEQRAEWRKDAEQWAALVSAKVTREDRRILALLDALDDAEQYAALQTETLRTSEALVKRHAAAEAEQHVRADKAERERDRQEKRADDADRDVVFWHKSFRKAEAEVQRLRDGITALAAAVREVAGTSIKLRAAVTPDRPSQGEPDMTEYLTNEDRAALSAVVHQNYYMPDVFAAVEQIVARAVERVEHDLRDVGRTSDDRMDDDSTLPDHGPFRCKYQRAEAAEAEVQRLRDGIEKAGKMIARALLDERVRPFGSDGIFLPLHNAQNILADALRALAPQVQDKPKQCRRCGLTTSAAKDGVLCEPPYGTTHDFSQVQDKSEWGEPS